MRSEGIMLPDGLRYASMRNVFRTRYINTAPSSDLTFSQKAVPRGRAVPRASPARARATTLSGFAGLLLRTAKGETSRVESERSLKGLRRLRRGKGFS